MKTNRLHLAMLAALLATAAMAGCKKDAPAPAPVPPVADTSPAPATPPPAMPATAQVNGVDLGNAVGADMRVTAPMTSFAAGDTIHASISTGTSDATASVPGKLGVRWTHVDSNQVVHEESRDITFAGDGVTDFQISKPGGWPTGKYRLEVMQDGAVVQTRDFEVK